MVSAVPGWAPYDWSFLKQTLFTDIPSKLNRPIVSMPLAFLWMHHLSLRYLRQFSKLTEIRGCTKKYDRIQYNSSWNAAYGLLWIERIIVKPTFNLGIFYALRGRGLIGLRRAFILHSVGYFCTALVPVGSNGVKNLFKRKVGSDFRFRDWSNFLTIRIEQLFENYVIVAHAYSVSLNRIESK